jgi:hypothetical protein
MPLSLHRASTAAQLQHRRQEQNLHQINDRSATLLDNHPKLDEELDEPTGADTIGTVGTEKIGTLDEDELEDEDIDPKEDIIVCTEFMWAMTIAWNRSNWACVFF